MLFGGTSFSAASFSSPGLGGATVLVNGNRLNIAIGNAIADVTVRVDVTGQQINLATGTINVISWNPIVPGATGTWIPIDPNNP
jgi:hypothetical protein|tara:strand:+ start:245 stop:496 length:252 start_codon:yes stop_codon:yes gene_type:complete